MSTTVEEIEKTETNKQTKNKLLLESLEIKGYRCFEHLTIEKLGRVNLIVGKNNVGKTALLESLSVFFNKGNFSVLINFLESRDEVGKITDQFGNKTLTSISFKDLFTSQNNGQTERSKSIVIGGKFRNNLETLSINLPKLRTPNGRLTEIGEKIAKYYKQYSEDEGLMLEVKYERENSDQFDLEYYNVLENSLYVKQKNISGISIIFEKADGLNNKQLLILWDEINKNDLKSFVLEAMKIIEKRIIDINFLGVPSGSTNLVPHIKTENSTLQIPLKRFGDGLNRLLSLSMALLSVRNGVLIVDEIESGLHYSVLPDVWKLIFKTARDLNVQVFATTHSYDCVQAFAEAAIDDEESEGNLIRLARKGDEIKAFTFDEKQLETITKEHIEVR